MPPDLPSPILPVTAARIGETLSIGGIPLPSLAATFGTPLYVYDQATLDDAVTSYETALSEHWPQEWELAYAAKAWLNTTLARWARDRGLGMDVVSEGELAHAVHAGFPAARVHAHGNNKSDQFLRACVEHGVGRVVIDHYREAERLAAICRHLDRRQAVWIRLNPSTAAPTHAKIETGSVTSKFGASIVGGEADRIAAFLLRDSSVLDWDGIHFHIGSQFATTSAQEAAIRHAVAWAARVRDRSGWTWRSFSPGGGWAVPYAAGDSSLLPGTAVPLLTGALLDACASHSLPLPRLVLEPGRELVARAAVAIYRLGALKQAGDVTYAFVDGGMADNPRPALYGTRYTALLVDRDRPATHRYRIAGPFCESGDVLIEEIVMPELREGDLIAVPVSGAYQLSMSSTYNAAPLPAVLWLHRGEARLVRQRQPLEALWRDEP